MSKQDSFGYRPELDGLRTVAVFLVVAYHAGLSVFSNGYLGVDVFFALSGFLVTNVLLNELHQHGRIRLTRFYARRIRRLLPAASMTILSTLAIARLVMTPDERAPIAGDARAAALWFANFNALDRVQEGIANPSPLLHFWSLSIEEQFYVAFPAVALLLFRLGPPRPRTTRLRTMWMGLGVATIIGAAVQVLVNASDWDASYYLTYARIYQMLAGAALAALLRSEDRLVPKLPAAVPGVALAGIVVLSLGIAPAVGASFRGAAVVGLMILLLAALMQSNTATTAALSHPAMVYLGGLSYAIYLFHVPIGVLLEYAVGPLNPWLKLLVTGAGSTALAAASSIVLETPIRKNGSLDTRHGAVIVVGLASAVLVALVAPAIV